MATEHHDFQYQESFLDDGFVPWCSCGWSGRERASLIDAQNAWENHCDAVFMAATEQDEA